MEESSLFDLNFDEKWSRFPWTVECLRVYMNICMYLIFLSLSSNCSCSCTCHFCYSCVLPCRSAFLSVLSTQVLCITAAFFLVAIQLSSIYILQKIFKSWGLPISPIFLLQKDYSTLKIHVNYYLYVISEKRAKMLILFMRHSLS